MHRSPRITGESFFPRHRRRRDGGFDHVLDVYSLAAPTTRRLFKNEYLPPSPWHKSWFLQREGVGGRLVAVPRKTRIQFDLAALAVPKPEFVQYYLHITEGDGRTKKSRWQQRKRGAARDPISPFEYHQRRRDSMA